MTPESAERLSIWRTEIAGELVEARKALPVLETEHTTATASASAAESAHRDLQTMLDAAFPRLTNPLATRLSWLRSELDEARGRVARANSALEAGRRKVDELERALRQLDHVIPQEVEAAA